jgi:hypothetical protein
VRAAIDEWRKKLAALAKEETKQNQSQKGQKAGK